MATILYTVRPGDSLWSIAEKFDTTVSDIARYNGISDLNLIFPGQRLRIFTSTPTIPRWYVVRWGDTLAGIANRFNTTVQQLVEYNNIQDPDVIYAGQVLRIRP